MEGKVMQVRFPLWGIRVRRAVGLLGVGALVLVAAACGGDGGEEGSSGESTVVYYSSRSESVLPEIEKEFEAAHPEIDLQVIKGGNDDIVARLLTEASKQQADVTDMGAAYMSQAAEAGILAELPKSLLEGLPEDAIGSDRLYAATRYTWHVIPYNTKLVPEDRVPRTHEDFLDPYWKDKFAIATGDVEWAFKEYLARGEDGTRKFFKKIKAQNPQIIDQGRGGIAEMVAAGQIAASSTTQNHNLKARVDAGLPIKGVEWEPPVLLIDYMATFKNAPHPKAAEVFLQWVFGPEGMAADAALGEARVGDPASVELFKDPDLILMDASNLKEQSIAAKIFAEEILGQ